jgi:hypothetical protein
MINLHNAIFALNSSIVTIRGDVAYDSNEREVTYSKTSAENKLAELQAQEIAQKQADDSAKQSAQNKLTVLGLTADEVKAL